MDPSETQPAAAERMAQARQVLHDRFGHGDFRAGQVPALESVLAGRNVLAVMPTGSGKSLLYQLPALLDEGLTLVVSPLIALMKDQVEQLLARGVSASFINSSLSLAQQQERLQQCLAGQTRLLYVAPERFGSKGFVAMINQVRVARLAVDEAHCISEWGHDFRPDYRRLKQFRQLIGQPVVTALTATATPRVQRDIIDCLDLTPEQIDVHVHGFDRPNLELAVAYAPSDDDKSAAVVNFLHAHPGPGIIYCGTRKAADELGAALRTHEPTTTVYHAGLEPPDRSAAQEAFLTGKARLAVATLAFGMGIDKRDVRFVIHYHYPGSVEQYYQEIGRAGRDGLTSHCLLLFAPTDRMLRQFFIDLNYPTKEDVRLVYDLLWSLRENPVMLTLAQLAEKCGLKDGQVGAAVRLLDSAGVTRALAGEAAAGIGLSRPGSEILPAIKGPAQRRVLESLSVAADLSSPGWYRFELGQIAYAADMTDAQVRRALQALADEGHIEYQPPFRGRGVEKLGQKQRFDQVKIDWQRQAALREIEEEKLRQMESYIRHSGCRREFIVQYFGEQNSLACGTCDNCRTAKQAAGEGSAKSPGAAQQPAPSGVLGKHRRVAIAALACIDELRFPLGAGKVAQVITGSRDGDLISWGLESNIAYGRAGCKMDLAKRVIDDLLDERYLKRQGEFNRPVLALTNRGKAVIQDPAALAELRSAIPRGQGKHRNAPASRPTAQPPGTASADAAKQPERNSADVLPETAATSSPQRKASSGSNYAGPAQRLLGQLVSSLLNAGREDAQAILEQLKLFHPQALAERLREHLAGENRKARARALWAAGQLCGRCGLELILPCADDNDSAIRQLVPAALGKIARDADPGQLDKIRQTLARLLYDPEPRVKQQAQTAIAQLPHT